MAPVDPEFIELIAARISYWRRRTANLQDENLETVDADRNGLWRTVDFGLALPTLAVATATLVCQSFPLIERRGYWADWLPCVLRASAVPVPPDLHIRLLNQAGVFYREMERPAEAINAHHQALALIHPWQDSRLEAETYFHLGNAHRANHQPDLARSDGLKALELLHRFPTPSLRLSGSTHNLLGLACFDLGDLAPAEQHFQTAIQCWCQLQDATYLGSSLVNLALVYQTWDKVELALDHYDQAFQILELTHSEKPKVYVRLNQSALYNQLQQFEASERVLRHAQQQPGYRPGRPGSPRRSPPCPGCRP